jgi:Zn-dependent protease
MKTGFPTKSKANLACTVIDAISTQAGDIHHLPELGTKQSAKTPPHGFCHPRSADHNGDPGRFSLKLGRLYGCALQIHWTFLLQLIITWLIYFHQTSGAAGALRSTLLVLIQFTCIFLHELGHLFAARWLNIKTIETTLYCMGGVAQLRPVPEGNWKQMAIAMAGPLTSFLISMGLFLAAYIAHHQNSPSLDQNIPILMSLGTANMLLVLHNLAPAFPFDGGRLLQMILATRAQAIRIPAWIGQGFSVIFAVSTLISNPGLIMNAFGIFCGARQQAAIAKLDSPSTASP